MAEKDQDAAIESNRRSHERACQQESNRHTESMTALKMAFTICIVFSICGVILILNGFEKIGSVLLGITLIGVVSSFLHQKKRK